MTEEEELEVSKALGQFQLTLNSLMFPLRMYGQGHYVDMASEQITHLAWQLHWRLQGLDIPYDIDLLHY